MSEDGAEFIKVTTEGEEKGGKILDIVSEKSFEQEGVGGAKSYVELSSKSAERSKILGFYAKEFPSEEKAKKIISF